MQGAGAIRKEIGDKSLEVEVYLELGYLARS